LQLRARSAAAAGAIARALSAGRNWLNADEVGKVLAPMAYPSLSATAGMNSSSNWATWPLDAALGVLNGSNWKLGWHGRANEPGERGAGTGVRLFRFSPGSARNSRSRFCRR